MINQTTISSKGTANAAGHPGNGHIGIYKGEWVDGKLFYTRDKERFNEWFEYANRHRIPPKGPKTRIILLGESVARGMLYDPYYVPAEVLEKMLNSGEASGEAEVIDLAVTNMRIEALTRLCSSCMALEPDALVIFAGNNWREDLFGRLSKADLEEIEQLLTSGGPAKTKAIIEACFSGMVKDFLSHIHALTYDGRIPVVFVIPEFNLADFQSTAAEQPVSALPDGATGRWLKARQCAQSLLAAGSPEEAAEYARQMMEIDASHPSGYELMALCRIRQNGWEEARSLLEQARDTAMFTRAASKPRILSAIRDSLLAQADRYHVTVIDLPSIFRTEWPGKIPDRDLFLDYCHLSAKGIRIAMQAVAEKLSCLVPGLPDGGSIRTTTPTVVAGKDVEGMAHLYAAIHNAHWGQPYEVVHYHCVQALRASPKTSRIMVSYIDLASRHASIPLCRSFETLVNSRVIDQYYHALIHPRDQKILDLILVDAMTDALKKVGINLETTVDELRKTEHGVENGPVDLLDSRYHLTSYDLSGMNETAYLRAMDIETRFFLITSGARAVLFTLTYRTPALSKEGDPVRVFLNGEILTSLPVSRAWDKVSFVAEPSQLRDGVNRITIQWPFSEAMDRSQQRSTAGAARPRIYFVFGEIHQFISWI
jgi:hypothetical protein